MMRTLGLLATLVACGCASGGGSSGPAAPATRDVSVGGGGFGTGTMTIGGSGATTNRNDLSYSADKVWKVLPAAFDSISVPISRLDPATKTIGNDAYKVRQRLGKTPLSRFFDCGTTQIGPNADSYDVYITLLVKVEPAGEGSRVLTTLDAVAQSPAFAQAGSRCSSRGSLEARLLKAITDQLK